MDLYALAARHVKATAGKHGLGAGPAVEEKEVS